MAIWKQLLVIIIAVCAAGFAVVRFVPGGADYVDGLGILPPDYLEAMKGPAEAPQARPGDAPTAPGSGRPNARSTLVVLGETTQVTINDRLTSLGIGAAIQSAPLTPSSSGMLTEVRIKSGAVVEALDVIAALDPSSEQVAYDEAKVAYDDAQRTLERFKQLSTSLSATGAQIQAAQLAVDKAELNLRRAKIDLDNRQVVSPIAGTIGIVHVTPGVEVTQSTIIATVEDDSAIRVSFDLPERFIDQINLGDPVSAVPISQPGTQLDAVVTAIDNRVDQASGSFVVEARIRNTDNRLRSGMSFTMTMKFHGDTYVAVPPLAVQWGSDGAYVWRVVDNKAQRVAVTVIQRNAENVLVSGELAFGEKVVTEGLDGLKDGATVRVADDHAANAPAIAPVKPRGIEAQPVGAAAASPAADAASPPTRPVAGGSP